MNTPIKVLLASLCVVSLTTLANAASVNSNGTLVDLTPPGNTTGTDVADLDSLGAATDGFYLFNSQPEGTNVSNQPWDQMPVNSLPAYVSTLDGTGSTSSGGWANYDDVLVGGLTFNTGGIVQSPGNGAEANLFSFTLGGAVPDAITVGLISDNSDGTAWAVTNARIEGPGGITADQSIVPNGGTDLILFEIVGGAAGETYSVHGTSPPSGSLFGGITFTSIPEPTSITLLAFCLVGVGTWRRRRAR